VIGRRIYVRIHRDWLLVRDVKKGIEVKEPALLALSVAPRKILATGSDALALRSRADVLVVNPFDHPRTPFSDFTVAEQLLHAFLDRIGARKFPGIDAMVIALVEAPEGGLTQVEIRVMQELAAGAGARRGVVWSGPQLSDEQVAKLRFPTTGEILN
jgi:rod shape-determining protein MreB and related proteins